MIFIILYININNIKNININNIFNIIIKEINDRISYEVFVFNRYNI